ncbi:hypothetical protein [Methanolobus sp.]|nr:hypothetical protein [Methanolobus sp.]
MWSHRVDGISVDKNVDGAAAVSKTLTPNLQKMIKVAKSYNY